MVCRGICLKYKAVKPTGRVGNTIRYIRGLSRYALGQKLCRNCNRWINWEGLFCPCCNLKVRQRPRKARGKELMNNV